MKRGAVATNGNRASGKTARNQDRRTILSFAGRDDAAVKATQKGLTGLSEALLAFVKVTILADAGHAQAGHAGAVDGALPPGKFLKRQAVPLARFIDAEQATADGGDDLGLAADHPAGRLRRRQ